MGPFNWTEMAIVVRKARLTLDAMEGDSECEQWQPDSPTYYCFGCIVDFVVLLFYYSVCVDRSGSLSGGAFNQLRLATLNIVLTVLY